MMKESPSETCVTFWPVIHVAKSSKAIIESVGLISDASLTSCRWTVVCAVRNIDLLVVPEAFTRLLRELGELA